MKILLDSDGKTVIRNGNPVYVADDGKEIEVDVPTLYNSVRSRTEQNQRIESENKSLKEQVKAFEGITDPAAARKAMETIKNLDDKKLVDAGDVERIKSEAIKAVEEKYAPVAKKASDLEQQLYAERIGGSFARSKTIADKFAIPADMVQARFGQHFKIEDGKTVAYDASGNRVFSRSRPGELADFDEALETLVDQYPYKAQILKGSGAAGGGASGGGQGGGSAKTYTRDQFASLSPVEQSSVSAAVRKGEAVLSD